MKIKELIFNSQSKFVYVSFISSLIGFLKSILLLKFFNFEILGLISLSQTFSSTISLMQIGVVTGGYRLFSYKKQSILDKVNSAVFVFFVLLSIVLVLLGLIIGFFYHETINVFLIIIFILIGILSLYSNWVICKLLGSKNIKIVNKVQIIAAIGSLILTFLAFWFGFVAVIFSLLIQPLIIIGFTYFFIPNLKPKFNFNFFKNFIKKIIYLGFIPYLTSALSIFNSQVGRWFITFSLGTIILGKTYLPALFVTLVGVFPGAISNLFFPKIIEKYENNEIYDLHKILKQQFYILLCYYIIIITITIVSIKFIIEKFLPAHIESINLVYSIIPTVVFSHLSIPILTYFNAAKKFKNILFGGGISTIIYLILLLIYVYFTEVKLLTFFIIESFSAFVFIIYNIYYFKKYI